MVSITHTLWTSPSSLVPLSPNLQYCGRGLRLGPCCSASWLRLTSCHWATRQNISSHIPHVSDFFCLFWTALGMKPQNREYGIWADACGVVYPLWHTFWPVGIRSWRRTWKINFSPSFFCPSGLTLNCVSPCILFVEMPKGWAELKQQSRCGCSWAWHDAMTSMGVITFHLFLSSFTLNFSLTFPILELYLSKVSTVNSCFRIFYMRNSDWDTA